VASEKKAPALSAKMAFLDHFLTVFHPKKGVKMKILKNPSAWSEIYPIVTI